MEKTPIKQFPFMGKFYYGDFIQFSVRMEIYEKKFPIYENCMMSIFGQPGWVCLHWSSFLNWGFFSYFWSIWNTQATYHLYAQNNQSEITLVKTEQNLAQVFIKKSKWENIVTFQVSIIVRYYNFFDCSKITRILRARIVTEKRFKFALV